jgi:serine protease AprX
MSRNQKTTSRFISSSIVILFILTAIIGPNHLQFNSAKTSPSYIVQGTDVDQIIGIIENHGGQVTSRLDIIDGVAARLPTNAFSKLLSNPAITAITPNAAVTLANQGYLAKNKPKAPETNYPDVVGADVVWEQGVTGENVSVAVVDTGLTTFKGLNYGLDGEKDRIIGWVDFVQGKKNPKDLNGHGTHIAGIIANTDIGNDGEWNGIAPGVDLVGVRVLDKHGEGTYEKVIEGIQWVLDHKVEYNIRVMNLSLISNVQSPYWADPLNQAVMQAWADGIVVVVAGGNGGPEPMTIGVPGNIPYVITVGAFTDNFTPYDWDDDYITPFSAAGPTLDGFTKPDVVAPGAHIVSLMGNNHLMAKDHPESFVAKDYYAIAGSSQAAAVVSGLAALTLSHNPNLTPDQVKYRIMYSSAVWVDPDTTEAIYSIWQQGAGRVNAPGAVFEEFDDGAANLGMDIWADLAGDIHYEGYSYYDDAAGVFRLKGQYGTWSGGYGTWSGGYGTWSGGYGTWSGGYGTWSGGYGTWSGGYGTWSGGYGTWSGGYGTWSGGYGTWSGGYGTWSGGYGTWSGGYGTWSGGYGTWSGSEPWAETIFAEATFVDDFLAGVSPDAASTTTSVGNWVNEP